MRALKIAAFVLFLSGFLIGQTNRGSVSGTVTDANGAIVPGVKVTIKNLGTNQTSTVTTSESGAYSISSLDPVEYELAAEAPNFKRAVISRIKVDTATNSTVNIMLEAGNVVETVTIESEGALVNTENASKPLNSIFKKIRFSMKTSEKYRRLMKHITVSNVCLAQKRRPESRQF